MLPTVPRRNPGSHATVLVALHSLLPLMERP